MSEVKLTDETIQTLEELFETGVTVAVACDRANIGKSTYHRWISWANSLKDNKPDPKIPKTRGFNTRLLDLLDRVTRARSRAHVAATITLRSAFTEAQQSVQTITETFEETRLRKVKDKETGLIVEEPYIYKRTTKRRTVNEAPPDWRAAVEYLKRQAPGDWSDRRIIRHETLDDDVAAAIVADIRNGIITPADYPIVAEEYGDSLAQELFRLAGHELSLAEGAPEGSGPPDAKDRRGRKPRSGWVD